MVKKFILFLILTFLSANECMMRRIAQVGIQSGRRMGSVIQVPQASQSRYQSMVSLTSPKEYKKHEEQHRARTKKWPLAFALSLAAGAFAYEKQENEDPKEDFIISPSENLGLALKKECERFSDSSMQETCAMVKNLPSAMSCSEAPAEMVRFGTTPSVLYHLAHGNNLSAREKINFFIQDAGQDAVLNTQIPLHKPNSATLRAMTYNIHFWTKPGGTHDDWAYEPIFSVIDRTNPDILMLQEVSFDRDSTRKEVEDLFEKRGYKYRIFQPLIASQSFGNMLVSKVPFSSIKTVVYAVDKDAQEQRGYIRAQVGNLVVYGTHLDVWDETGKRREQEMHELVQAMNAEHSAGVMVLGDFNAVRSADYSYRIGMQSAWDILQKDDKNRFEHNHPNDRYAPPRNIFDDMMKNGYKDCFAYTGKAMPRYTVWSGKVVDFIFLKKSWQLPIAGCYAYYTAASDHLPLIIDITTKK